MKRWIAGAAAVCLAAVLAFPVRAISARQAILLDAQTGRVLYEKNADRRGLIASTTKIMTALLICEQCNVLDRVRIPEEAVGIEGSSMYLRSGEVLTVQELLYGLMLRSGNDAAVALAIYCGGTVEEFVSRMNDKAHALGLTNTHFENPNGLDSENHYSTPRDLAILAAYAMENPIFAQTVSTRSVRAGERVLQNHNKLLWQVDGADGVKTGYTKAAGRILVSSATRDGRRLIAVTMDDSNDWQDHKQLLEEGFSRYCSTRFVTKGDVLGSLPVIGGECDRVELIAGVDFCYSLADGESLTLSLGPRGFVYAPVCAGEEAGEAYVLLGEKVVGKIPLYCGAPVERQTEEKKSLWERIGGLLP